MPESDAPVMLMGEWNRSIVEFSLIVIEPVPTFPELSLAETIKLLMAFCARGTYARNDVPTIDPVMVPPDQPVTVSDVAHPVTRHWIRYALASIVTLLDHENVIIGEESMICTNRETDPVFHALST